MHRTLALGVVLALWPSAPSGLSPTHTPGSSLRALCSLDPTQTARGTTITYFVGTAVAETVLAGAGAVRPTGAGGHWGSGRPRAIYGQVILVDTLGGAESVRVRAALAERGDRAVVVVPWDYDPGCEPTYWSTSARWVEPGLEGFYTVQLRAESLWASGRPTFDAFMADFEPYPHGAFYPAGYRGTDALRSRSSLTAREMFSLYTVLPVYTGGASPDSAALGPLRAWEAAHPELARKYPADIALRWLLRPDSIRRR